MAASSGMNDAETRDLNHFIDLLEHCLTLNPDKRMKRLMHCAIPSLLHGRDMYVGKEGVKHSDHGFMTLF
jgi:hypothetical protein